MRGDNLKGKPRPEGAGRKKGTVNKITKEIKDMVIGALEQGGGQAWLVQQMEMNPVAFMGLIGKIIPHQVKAQLTGSGPNGEIEQITRIERVIIKPGANPPDKS